MILLVPSVSGAVVAAAAQPAQANCSHVASDFNGDGFADVAVGAQYFDSGRGRVAVAFGAAGGLATTNGEDIEESQFSQITPADDDFFGASIAAGNFNGDCYADLAIAVPGDTPRGDLAPRSRVTANGGAFVILYGSPSGLTGGSQVFFMNQFDPSDETAGSVDVVAGDFNGDGKTDLAVSSVSPDLDGRILVLHGSSSGITTSGKKTWSQATAGVPGSDEVGDGWGVGLVAADFTGDGKDDLAIGAPGEDYPGVGDGGAVTILKGSSGGLTATGSKVWTENTAGVPGTGENEDFWGAVLAAGDINGDGKADLVIGDPLEDIGSTDWAGAVTILHGSSSGILTTSHAQLIDQNTSGVPGTAEANDEFGQALAVGDVNGDGRGDVAIGDQEEAIGNLASAGTVTVLPGTSTGVSTSKAKVWDQNTAGIQGTSEGGDSFGNALVALPIRADGVDDLIIGVDGERIGSLGACGAVAIIPGGSGGLTATGNQLLTPGTLVTGSSVDEGFGGSVD
jgi:hypothetical protein